MTTTITSPATLLTQMTAAQGVAGISAYAVAVKNGYTGTEAEWLLTLVGPAWPSTGVQAASEAARDAAVIAKDLAVAAKDTAVLSATSANDDAVAVALAKASVDSSTTTVTELAAQVNVDVGVIAGYKDTVALDKAAVALDKAAVAADKLTVAGYKDTVALDKAAVALDKSAVAADKLTVSGYKDAVDTDRADVALDKAAVAADKLTVAGYKDTVALDKAAVALDKAAVAADKLTVSGYKDTVALDKAAVALDTATVAADKLTVSGYKDAVATDKTDTLSYRNSASDSAVAAALSASNADTSEAMAQAWAITPVDTLVSDVDYSALHWAAKSAISQGLAGSSATSANDAKVAAQAAAASAVAVVTGGTASLTPAAGKIPLADGTGKVDAAWLDLLPTSSNAALHRSPNAITAMFVYDTSKDSDGGAWVEKCQHTSWCNEPLCGKWLGRLVSEAAARAVTGAVTSDYYQLTTDGKFYKLNAVSGVTEVFRGNKQKFPKIATPIAEAASISVYDATEPGLPLWRRWSTAGAMAIGTISSVFASQGLLYVGGSTGLAVIDLTLDRLTIVNATNVRKQDFLATTGVANLVVTSGSLIASATVNSVAMTVLPDAPLDVVSGLKRPTIAVATNSGVSIIKHDGTVVSSQFAYVTSAIAISPEICSWSRSSYKHLEFVAKPGSASASFPVSAINAASLPAYDISATNLGAKAVKNRAISVAASGVRVIAAALNESTAGKGLAATITDTFSTGYMLGDIRRCYMAGTVVGVVSNPSTLPDRSYKAATATVYGVLTAAPITTGAQLVSYSGFSGTNYLRENYSADLDVGTGEFSFGAAVPSLGMPLGGNLCSNGDELWYPTGSIHSVSTKPTAVRNSALGPDSAAMVATKLTFTSINGERWGPTTSNLLERFPEDLSPKTISLWIRTDSGSAVLTLVVRGDLSGSVGQNITVTSTWTRFQLTVTPTSGWGTLGWYIDKQNTSTIPDVYVCWGQFEAGSTATTYKPTLTASLPVVTTLVSRAYASGPSFTLTSSSYAKLTATLYDGTTTRSVVSATAYATNTIVKVAVNYRSGRLALEINGIEVAATIGAPLLTLNNSNAVLTIGNSYDLSAPFPGSICMVKLGATVPTPEQSLWVYEQEKAMFRAGAQVCLPEATTVSDLTYDPQTDTWVAVQAGNESSWVGLTRVATAVPSAGTFSKAETKSGIKLLSRATTSPGVDVSISGQTLLESLSKRAEAANLLNRQSQVFDFDTVGFTCTTVNGQNTMTSVASLVGTPYIGMYVIGTGIPAGTYLTGINGTTYYMSANATASNTVVTTGQTSFTLPAGFTAIEVVSAGSRKREGSTKDWTRSYDGFRETVRFAASPGSAAWVQITAKKD